MPPIALKPMEEEAFGPFLKETIADFAKDKAVSEHIDLDVAQGAAERSVHSLLADGLQTQGHYLYSVWPEDAVQPVGALWFMVNPETRSAFLCNIIIYEARRGEGLGRAAMESLEELARAMGCLTLRLHVFQHNRIARRLYQHLGFETTGLNLCKQL